MASYSAIITPSEVIIIITPSEVIIAGVQSLKMAVLCFVDVSEEEMVSQQILNTVMTRIDVDKSTDHAKPHLICFLPQYQR